MHLLELHSKCILLRNYAKTFTTLSEILVFVTLLLSCQNIMLQSYKLNKGRVVYNCFFVETAQATTHCRDITLRAIVKVGMWVTAGSFPG